MNARMREDSRIEHLRVPPHSVEAEQAVLGGLMLAPNARTGGDWFDVVAERLTAESFYRRDHQLIWEAIAHLREKGRPFDAVTLGEWFENAGQKDVVGNGAYLIELASTTPSAANIRGYAAIVADKALLRRMIQVGTEIVDNGFRPDHRDVMELVGQAQTGVASLLEAQPCEAAPMEVSMEAAWSELCERHARKEGLDGLATGFADYDEILGGLVPGIHLIGGRPKHGKSTLAQNIAEHVALNLRQAVLIVILEMTEKQFAKRVMASVGRVDSQRMRRGTLDDVDWASVSAAVRRLRGQPLFITRPGGMRIEHIVAQIRKQHAKQIKARNPLKLVVIDYLQLIDVIAAKGENYSTAIGRVTRSLANLAQELALPILLLSQLNRESEKDGSRPKASHLRDSGSIEADAESITLVYNEGQADPKSKYAGTIELIVAANRNGAPGTCRLKFNGAEYRCENLPDGWEPTPEPPKEEKGASKPRGFRRGAGNQRADAAAGDR